MKTFRKTLITVLFLFFFGALFYAGGLSMYYFRNLPKIADIASGHIHKMDVSHGSIRYGTVEEVMRFQNAERRLAFAAAGALLGGILNAKFNDFPASGRKRLPLSDSARDEP